MKKTFIFIAVLIALGTPSYASHVSQQWIKTYGGSEQDMIHCTKQTIDGGYIAAGNHSVIDLFVMKLDVNGDISWRKNYRYFTWINDAYAIQRTTDGGYIVAGCTMSLNAYGGWILKLDGNGNIIWQKAYDGIVQFKSIQQTTDGGYIAAGQDMADVILLRLDSTGNINWGKAYRLDNLQEPSSVLQTYDEGYIVAGHTWASDYDIWIFKVDNDGNISWQKRYDGGRNNDQPSIQQTSDGGFVIANCINCGAESEDLWVLKLDGNGSVVWQRTYGGYDYETGYFIQQTIDGNYTVSGGSKSFHGTGDYDGWLLKLDSNGEIVWEKTYGGFDEDSIVYHGNTSDGGSIVAVSTDSYASGVMTLKLDSNGDVPGCDIVGDSHAIVSAANMTIQNTNATVESPQITVFDTDTIPQDIVVDTSVLCYFEDPNDIDGDGVESNPGGAIAGSMLSSSFLADGDNCSDMPNGPYLGTCTSGKVGSPCIAHAACGANGICSLNQEDTFPPQGNGIGDACDCEGNFNCDTDSDVDGSDAALFKAAFGRSIILEPCTGESPCNGDFNCDGDADGTDAAHFKADFGRSSMQNPCPACVVGVAWCGYEGPFISGYSNSGCLGSFMEFEAEYNRCGDDEIVAESVGDTIHITHFNASYTCCPQDIAVTLTVDGNILRLTEREIPPVCRCLCCYTIESEIDGVEPGEYTIEYCWYSGCDTVTALVSN